MMLSVGPPIVLVRHLQGDGDTAHRATAGALAAGRLGLWLANAAAKGQLALATIGAGANSNAAAVEWDPTEKR
eukprot:3696992-Alexandrium_andersonii.AAC.1